MRRFLGIFLMGMLALGVADAKDYSSLSGKELIKLAGTVPAADALDYRMAVFKHIKSLKTAKAKRSFKAQLDRVAQANLKKMSKKDFMAMREEVRKDLEEMKKEHTPEELKAMGLGLEVCKGEVRKVWCYPHHGKRKHKGAHGAHKGSVKGHGHGHHGAKKGHEEEHKGAEKAGSKGGAEEHKEKEVKTPAKSEGAEEHKGGTEEHKTTTGKPEGQQE